MLNRTGWRYLSSRPLRRVAPHALAVARPAGAPAWLLTRQSAATNPAPCGCLFFFFRRCDRHASSSSSPSQRDSLSPATDLKRGTRETSPLKASSPTDSSHVTDVGDDEDLEDASADMPPAEPLSWKERAKTFAVEYGRVGIATHIVLSVVSISVIYGAISSGVDVSGLLHSLGVSPDSAGKDSAATSAGSFILAYAVYKVAAPLRWPLTFAVTPVVMRALRRRGYMLPKTKSNAHRSPRPEAEDAVHGDDHGVSRK